MIDLSEEFDNLFKDKGGIFKLSTSNSIDVFLGKFLKEGEIYVNHFRRTKPGFPPITIHYIANPNLNAAASKSNNNYFIGVNIGTVILLNQLFLRMLSSPNILTEWGDVKSEGETKKIFNAMVTNMDTYMIAKDPIEKIRPNDITRFNLADLLTSFSMKFLFLHEIAHIFNGHIDYLCNLDNNFIYFENQKIEKLSSLNSQTMEFDADAFAAQVLVNELKSYVTNASLPDVYKPFFSDMKVSLKLSFFAVNCFFRLFGMEKPDKNKLNTYSHPPSSIRIRNFYAGILTFIESGGEEFRKEIGNSISETRVEVERAFIEISNQDFDLESFGFALTPESNEHIRSIRKNWSNVRPLLEPYALNGLAPIQIIK